MQLTGETNNLDLTSEIDLLCDSDSRSYKLQDKVRRINYSLEELVGEIIVADGTWEFDDTNFTDLPVGKETLVEGQESYTFTNEYLAIQAIEILNVDNTYVRIKNLDHTELGGLSPQEYFGVDSSGVALKGFPNYYDLVGDTFRLYPSPTSTDVTLTNGVRVWFKRTVDLFTTSDTTQEPGLPSPYHHILAYMAAIPYCMSYKKDRVALYQNKVDKMKTKLLAFYGQREKDKKKIFRTRFIHFR